MRFSITIKWTLTLLLSSLIGVALVGFFAYWTTTREFDRFRSEVSEQDFIEDVILYYETENNLDGIHDYFHQGEFNDGEHENRVWLTYALVSLDGVVLSGAGPFKLDETLQPGFTKGATPVVLDAMTIAYVIHAVPPPGLSPDEQEYLDNTNRALIVGVIGASSVAVLVGLLLSRQFLYPLSELTEAITAMKSGELHQQVTVETNDELGQLAETFNQMSAEIHRANQLRKQMTADIAHDLRTPLQVITGYIEAMRDGVLPATPERFDAMNQEALLLKRLVNDLRTLSLADAKELKLVYQNVEPESLLNQIHASFATLAQQENIALQVEVATELPVIQIDRERMVQVLTNLVSNALRYTSAGGMITLVAKQTGETLQFIVQDTGTGIPEDKLANIFERFYRVDESRHEVEGESGLGLAIVKSIVEAHEGTVIVSSKPGEGSIFTITLPL